MIQKVLPCKANESMWESKSHHCVEGPSSPSPPHPFLPPSLLLSAIKSEPNYGNPIRFAKQMTNRGWFPIA